MRYITALLLVLPFSLAVPTPQSGDVECGRDDYTGDEISAAANAACNYLQHGTTAGGSKYPELYNDYEGFSFGGVQGPYYEFPILEDGSIYDGGSPGADRVIINESCEIAGEVTHSGASGNGFVGCSGTSKRKEKL